MVEEFFSQLENLYKNKPNPTASITALDAQTRNQLEALGYLVLIEDSPGNKADNDKEVVGKKIETEG